MTIFIIHFSQFSDNNLAEKWWLIFHIPKPGILFDLNTDPSTRPTLTTMGYKVQINFQSLTGNRFCTKYFGEAFGDFIMCTVER